MDTNLKYADEADKCYGITGMAIGLVVLEAEHVLAGLSLDASADEVVEFTPDYYFSGNPRVSAKIAWNQILQHFQVSMGMLIGNVMCRHYIHRHSTMTPDIKAALLECVDNEGRETCSLDSDEVKRLYDKCYDYLNVVFRHNGVHSVADDFARELAMKRRMSRSEVLEHLHVLSRL